MPRTYYKKVKTWSEQNMQLALSNVTSGVCSGRSARRKYGIPESTLRGRKKLLQAGREYQGSGRKPVLPRESEAQLVRCIETLCQLGFSPTASQIRDLVQDYIRANEIKNPFTSDRPGKDWLYSFMKRNKLSLKKANMISSARKSATSNPFVINDFYDMLEQIIKENNLTASQIWNCDESGFPTDPKKCNVVSIRGRTAYKVTCGAGRENITTLAVCNAAGRALDPLIIFTGKNLQSTWRGEKALPGTFYGVSENGWMTTEIFAEWFSKFCELVEERPLLLIFDGHLTHVSLPVVEKAIAENIFIMKLPPHATDLLQPLDVSCFGPLKREWETILNNWIYEWGPKEPLKRANFVNMLSEIWYRGLSPKNIMSGFHATGIFPVNRNMYPGERFDRRLVRRYEKWVAAGKPEEMLDNLIVSVDTPEKLRTPRKLQKRVTLTEEQLQPPLMQSTPTESIREDEITSASTSHCSCSICNEIGTAPPPVPGYVWFPNWQLQKKEVTPSETSFEEALLDKIIGPTNSQPNKRRKIDMKSKIVTDEEYVNKLKEKEIAEKTKANKTVKKRRGERGQCEKSAKNSKGRKNADFERNEEKSEISEDENRTGTDDEIRNHLQNVWKSVVSPEKSAFQRWWAAIYTTRKKDGLFVGREIKRFRDDVDGPYKSVELDCLKPRVGSGTIFESIPSHLPRDIDIFPVHNIVAGPLVANPLRGEKWEIPDYDDVRNRFREAVEINREKLFKKFLETAFCSEV